MCTGRAASAEREVRREKLSTLCTLCAFQLQADSACSLTAVGEIGGILQLAVGEPIRSDNIALRIALLLWKKRSHV